MSLTETFIKNQLAARVITTHFKTTQA